MSSVAIRPIQQHYFLRSIYFFYTRHVSAINRRYYKNINGKVAFYIFVLSPDDGRTYRPKHVAYIRRKWVLEHLCSCIGLIAIKDINLTNTTGWQTFSVIGNMQGYCLSVCLSIVLVLTHAQFVFFSKNRHIQTQRYNCSHSLT